MSIYLGDKKVLEVCTGFDGMVETETLTVTPTKYTQVKTPSGNKVFSEVIVNPIPASYAEVEGTLNITANGTYDVSDKASAVVKIQGGEDLNIAYGEVPPTDTEKVWIKSSEPAKLTVDYDPTFEPMSYDEFLVIEGKKYNNTNSSIAVGNIIYIFGDKDSPKSGITKIDTTSKAYEILNMPLFDGIVEASLTVSGSLIYIWSTDCKLYAFDTLTDTLDFVASIDAASQAKIIIRNGYLYFIGGQSATANKPVNSFKRYNLSTGELTSLANLYEPLKRMVVVQYSNYIYLFGGIDSSGYEDGIFRYSFFTETWSKMSEKLPVANSDMCHYMAGDAVYMLLGQNSNARIWRYDLKNNAIKVCVLQSRYNYCTAFAQVGSAFYAIGSYTDTNGFIDKVYKLSFSCELEKDTIFFVQNYTGRKVKLVSGQNNVYMYIKNVFKGDDSGQAEYCDVYVYIGTNWVNVNTGTYYSAS
ncbi:MAG: hypothetical protein SO373_03220 [Candidatus Borkfalkiaceae bacterium]|nr:hypothetical protein [Christensenellaceae bacterium]